MTENPTNSSKVEEKNSSSTADDAGEDLLSLENLDAVIDKDDPEFNKNISDIAPVGDADELNLDLIDIDQIMADEQSKSIKGRIKKIFKRIRKNLILFYTSFVALMIKLAKEDFPLLLQKLKEKIKLMVGQIQEWISLFFAMPVKKKLALFVVMAGLVGVGIYVRIIFTEGVLSDKTELFTLSLEQGADEVVTYDPLTESEPFYDSPRASQNLMILSRMTVNLQASSRSGSTPMGAFEFFIEGNSPDVMVEIKDREHEVRDLFQRTIEEMSYDQMVSADGKQLLQEKLRRAVNRILTKGQVRKIFYKTAILKP